MARQIQMGQQPPSEKPPARTGRRARGAPPPPPEPPPPPAANETASKLVTFQPPQGPGVPQRPFATGRADELQPRLFGPIPQLDPLSGHWRGAEICRSR